MMRRKNPDRPGFSLRAAVWCCLAGLAATQVLYARDDKCKVPPWPVSGQTEKEGHRADRTPGRTDAERYFRVSPPKDEPGSPDSNELKQGLKLLGECCKEIDKTCPIGDAILEAVYGVRRHELPNLIVFLEPPEDSPTANGKLVLGSSEPRLLWREKSTPHVFGVDHVWVLVFSEHRLELKAEITTLFEKSGNPFAGLLGLLKVVPADEESKPAESKSAYITWRELPLHRTERRDGTGSASNAPLFLGSARLPVAADSVNFLTLVPDEQQEEQVGVDFHLVSAHFSNSRPSPLAFSVGLATTMNTQDTSFGAGGSEFHFNGYALAKLYARRPRVKAFLERGRTSRRSRPSVGLVLGTNVDKLFDEIVFGVSVGHLFGRTGLIVGVNRIPESDDFDRKWRPIVGFEYTF